MENPTKYLWRYILLVFLLHFVTLISIAEKFSLHQTTFIKQGKICFDCLCFERVKSFILAQFVKNVPSIQGTRKRKSTMRITTDTVNIRLSIPVVTWVVETLPVQIMMIQVYNQVMKLRIRPFFVVVVLQFLKLIMKLASAQTALCQTRIVINYD